VDVNDPKLGGRVKATEYKFDVRTFTIGKTDLHGVYGEDFLTFAEFDGEADTDRDETLI